MSAAQRRVVIRASAGAGKTYQLVNEYLRHLHAGADPTSLLAVTFTRKAAGEILASIIERLVHAAEDTDLCRELGTVLNEPSLSTTDCHRLLGHLVDALHRLSVGTIDSFFHRLASAFRWELDLPVAPRMADALDPEVAALRQEVITEVLATGDPGVLTGLFRRHHGNRAARAVGQALDTLVLKLHDVWRMTPDRDLWDRLEVPVPLGDEEVAQAMTGMHSLHTQIPENASGGPNKPWQNALDRSLACCATQEWGAFCGSGIVAKILEGQPTFSRKEIPPIWADTLAPLIHHARAILLEEVRQKHLASHDLLTRFDAGWNHLRRGRRLLMFSDLISRLARQLPDLLDGELPRARHRLDAALNHLLLDEFQDTSPSQWQILEPFADDVTGSGSGDGTLFVVGDMKQAIYGWRGGNAALFREVEARYQIQAQDLATSFRSVPVVMDLVNAVYADIGDSPSLAEHEADANAAHSFAGDFQQHASAHHLTDLPGYVVLRSTVAPRADEHMARPDDLLDEFPEAPASAVVTELEDVEPPTSHEEDVARYVAALHGAHPAGSIAVLVRTNVMGARLLHEFRRTVGDRQPLPVSGEGGAPLSGSPAVAAILSAFALADAPGDTASAYHVATSPLGEVVDLTSDFDTADAKAASHRIRRDLQQAGYSVLVSRWITALAPFCDVTSLERLQQLLGLAQRHEPTSRPSDFIRFVEATSVEQGDSAPIRVMTIHAAKGLEFDTVVLPELDNQRRDVYPVLLERESESAPPVGVLPFANAETRLLSAQLQAVYTEERTRRRYEDLCLLYVALTRARRAVHMLIKPKNPARKEHRLCADLLREALAPGIDLGEDGNEVFYEAGEPRWFETLNGREQDTPPPQPVPGDVSMQPVRVGLSAAGAPRRAWPATSPSAREGGGRVTGAEILAVAGADARTRGLVFHEWFQQVSFADDPEGVPNDDVLRNLVRRQAPAVAPDVIDAWLGDFHAALETPAIHAVLQRNGANHLWSERAFALKEDGQLLQGRFDRVAVWDDHALLVDFKTDAAGPEAMDLYRPQVDSYKLALSRLLALSSNAVVARLVFVATGDVLAV
jgi:ATP-dependent helicase/nuclease subunit A